ncbi:putative nucleotidyltransferase, ribonuclease H [Tanacetum coccineum]
MLPTTQKRHDAIWVVVDRLTKSAHFLPIRKNYGISKLAEIFQQEKLDNHVQKALGNRLKFSTTFHPQTMSVREDHSRPLKNMVKRLLKVRTCNEITNEKVAVAKEKLKEARSRQKSYADKHRRDLEFQVGDRVFLKVSPFRGVKRFGIKGKLSPRFIGPFEILERIGEVSYPDMSLSEEPESILDRQERVMRNKVIPFVKILWKNHPEREATWETEESMRASYPHFFV